MPDKETGGQYAGTLVQYSGTNGISYREVRDKVNAALSKVGKTFEWHTSEPQQFDLITAQQIQDLIDAADTAYVAYANNCSSKNGANRTANDGYSAGNSSVYTSNLSTVYSGVNSGYCSSNLSALYSTKNVTVKGL